MNIIAFAFLYFLVAVFSGLFIHDICFKLPRWQRSIMVLLWPLTWVTAVVVGGLKLIFDIKEG